jgi:hypothetical protein
MSYVKITSFLALVSTVAAVPHYSHGKFHSKVDNKPYPSGGWAGQLNSTVPVAATGTGVYGTTTLGLTQTSTATLVSTIYAGPSGIAGDDVAVEHANTDDAAQCGGTVTVTASEKVTVTVTPGGGAGVPQSSAAQVESKADNGYGAPSVPAAEYPAETPAVETPTKEKTTAAVETPVAKTSAPAVETPTQEKTTPAAEYPAETPKASSTSLADYTAPGLAKKPLETPSAGASYSGGKRGLAYNDAHLCKNFGSNFGFGYNWGQVESNDIGTNFIPMMHGPSKGSADEWLSNVKKAVAKGSNAVMGFNECDHAEQCNLSPEAACSAWKEYMNPVKDAHSDVTVIGPSVTNSNNPGQGLEWLSSFHDSCPDATVDATNIHFYDIYDNGTVDRFKAHVEKAAKIYGKPVWITEFGLNPGSASEEQAASFLKEAMAYCDGSDQVQGYSYFMVGDGENQLNSGSGLSAVGKVYAGQA